MTCITVRAVGAEKDMKLPGAIPMLEHDRKNINLIEATLKAQVIKGI